MEPRRFSFPTFLEKGAPFSNPAISVFRKPRQKKGDYTRLMIYNHESVFPNHIRGEKTHRTPTPKHEQSQKRQDRKEERLKTLTPQARKRYVATIAPNSKKIKHRAGERKNRAESPLLTLSLLHGYTQQSSSIIITTFIHSYALSGVYTILTPSSPTPQPPLKSTPRSHSNPHPS